MTQASIVSPSESAPPSKAMLWVSRVLSALPVLMLLLSASMKLSHAPKFVEAWTGTFLFQESQLTPIGILEIVCTILYVIPRTSVLGVVLLTGYLGGAIVPHVRVGQPFMIPLVLGVLLWAGLYLRDARIRTLLPLRS